MLVKFLASVATWMMVKAGEFMEEFDAAMCEAAGPEEDV